MALCRRVTAPGLDKERIDLVVTLVFRIWRLQHGVFPETCQGGRQVLRINRCGVGMQDVASDDTLPRAASNFFTQDDL